MTVLVGMTLHTDVHMVDVQQYTSLRDKRNFSFLLDIYGAFDTKNFALFDTAPTLKLNANGFVYSLCLISLVPYGLTVQLVINASHLATGLSR